MNYSLWDKFYIPRLKTSVQLIIAISHRLQSLPTPQMTSFHNVKNNVKNIGMDLHTFYNHNVKKNVKKAFFQQNIMGLKLMQTIHFISKKRWWAVMDSNQ